MRIPRLSNVVCAMAACVLAPSGVVRAQLSEGLLNYWDFEGDFEDSASNYLGNASTVADHGTNAAGNVSFDGDGPLGTYGSFAGDFVEVPNSDDVIAAGESLSISAWFRVDGFNQDWQALIAHGEGSDYRIARRGSETVMAYAGGTGDIPGGAIGPVVNDGAWHHVVAITEAGVSTRLWVDGSLVATSGGAAILTNNGAARMMIGGNPDTPAAYRAWNGGIDDVAMWNRPLTPQQVADIYNGGLGGQSLAAVLQPDDSDGDGLPDYWEVDNGLDPNDDGTVGESALGARDGPNGADGDPDGDLSPNSREFARGTDPRDADSDDDGLLDGVETGTGLWVSVMDTGTNPLNADSDNDGLPDGVENPDFDYDPDNPQSRPGTDPNLADSDGDLFPDGFEVQWGSDPTDSLDVPTGNGNLPLADNFDDNFLNPFFWTTNTAIPQGGASVTERNQRIELIGRGYLNTTQQYDPEVVGGLRITGQWTFISGDDFMQVIVRSDGLPAGEYGETANGIEFNVALTDPVKDLQILSRDNATIQVTQDVTGVLASAAAGMPFDFEIIDDGLGGLSFTMTEAANPANTATSTASIIADSFDQNFVAFHNRESGRVSYLDNVSITSLATDPLRITGFGYDPTGGAGGDGSFSLTWNSIEGRLYGVYFAADLVGFGADVDDSIPADPGDSTTYTFDHPLPAAPELFFRVQQN